MHMFVCLCCWYEMLLGAVGAKQSVVERVEVVVKMVREMDDGTLERMEVVVKMVWELDDGTLWAEQVHRLA